MYMSSALLSCVTILCQCMCMLGSYSASRLAPAGFHLDVGAVALHYTCLVKLLTASLPAKTSRPSLWVKRILHPAEVHQCCASNPNKHSSA